ncbi:MAG: YqgE/AlgH family protein [Bacteroidota bacterium]
MINFTPTNGLQPAKGRILISEPFLADPYFKRTVVLLCEHDDSEGSFGLIINKFIDVRLDQLIDDFPETDARVSMGGPISKDSLYYIHTRPDLIPNSNHVVGKLYWGGDFEALAENVKTGMLKKREIRFFIGYAGWSENQLKRELDEQSWIVNDASVETIMNGRSNEMWQQSLKNLGKEFAVLANFPEDPKLN